MKNNNPSGRPTKKVNLRINNTDIEFESVNQLAEFLGLSGAHISNIIAGREKLPVIKAITIV